MTAILNMLDEWNVEELFPSCYFFFNYFLCVIIYFKLNISLLTVLLFECTTVCTSVTRISSVKTQPDAIMVKPQQRKKIEDSCSDCSARHTSDKNNPA